MKPTFKTNCSIHGIDADAFLNGSCRKCDEEENKKVEAELANKIFISNQHKANIPARFLSASFDNFVTINSEQNYIKSQLANFNLDANILLLGKTGVGKTHLAIAVLNKMISQGISCYYSKFYKLSHYKIKQPNEFERIIISKLLVIDEFGVEDSEYKSTVLFEVIDERYDRGFSTILISNKKADEVKRNISHATYSRIKECCYIYQFPFDDYRLKKQYDDFQTKRAGGE
jgi:DNA replication protein DnaC